MGLINYFKQSFKRKKARRVTLEYPGRIDVFELENEGKVDFVNWDNPLVKPIVIRQEAVDFFKKFIKKGDLVIDIGSNIGDTTIPIALAAGKEGLTLAFDPNPFVFKILSKNAALNSEKTNIHPYCMAISDQAEEYYYISSEASFSNGGISQTKKNKVLGKFIFPDKIKGIKLQDFLETNYPDWQGKLSFIKIDAEGYDKEIIISITDLVLKYKPVIIAESWGLSTAEEIAKFYDAVIKMNYELFYFEDFFAEAKIEKIKSREHFSNYRDTMNFYAIPVL